jgi:hypothetical protein
LRRGFRFVLGVFRRKLAAVMRGQTNVEKIRRFMRELGWAARSPGRIYFTGGVTAVLLGWREMTLDIDLKADPEPSGFFEALPGLKEKFDLNIELASPEDFVPALPGWAERSVGIGREEKLEFLHYDFYGQALAKIERFHQRDQLDVERMLADGWVQRGKLWELFCATEPKLIRYPAIDPKALRERVRKIAGGGQSQ